MLRSALFVTCLFFPFACVAPGLGESVRDALDEASKLPLGAVCKKDADCEKEFSCLPIFVAGQCTDELTCTSECQMDSDCTPYDDRGKCLQGCNNLQICMLVEEAN